MLNVTFYILSRSLSSLFSLLINNILPLISLHPLLDELLTICQDYFDRMYQCESQKYDMEFECRKKDFEVEWLEFCPCQPWLGVTPCLNDSI